MDEDGYDDSGMLTPIGLAQWMDQEGGIFGLWMHSGTAPFIEAGCDQALVAAWESAQTALEAELARIGATL